MFKIAFEILIKVAMSEHMYSFNGDLRKQKAGGTIGNVLTCAVAVLFTVWWCQKFLDKVNEACRDLSDFVVYLLKIYIDYQNLACEALPPGARLMDGKVTIVESEIEGLIILFHHPIPITPGAFLTPPWRLPTKSFNCQALSPNSLGPTPTNPIKLCHPWKKYLYYFSCTCVSNARPDALETTVWMKQHISSGDNQPMRCKRGSHVNLVDQ